MKHDYYRLYHDCLDRVFEINPEWHTILASYDFILKLDKTKYYGWCDWAIKQIQINQHKLDYQDEPEVIDTILHEMAHAIHAKYDGFSDHSPRWRHFAKSIGANPRATGKPCKAPKDYRFVWVLWDGEIKKSYSAKTRKPRNVPVNVRMPSMFWNGEKERTLGKLKLITWSEWVDFCDSYGLDYTDSLFTDFE